MRTIFFTVGFLCLFFGYSFAQTNTFPLNGAAGIGTANPNTSSLLEIVSTTKGVLISRMTKAQRDAIASPATGLLIYQTNSTPGFYYFDGSGWAAVTPKNKGWSLTGNAGTVPGTNFIGTTDAQPLSFKVNNSNSGLIDFDVNKANTSFGYQSLFLNSTGNFNTAVGLQSLNSNSSGSFNTAHGSLALSFNTTGTGNSGVGYASLFNNTTGIQNTALGTQALSSNTTANDNTAVGFKSLYSNSTGYSNVSVGSSALYINTIGNYNTAVGFQSLNSNSSGSFNTAHGSLALSFNTTGAGNTAMGYASFFNNTTGSNNTANGNLSLYSNTTGYSNVAIGIKALYLNTVGHNLVAVGDSALYNQGYDALNTYGNTAIGSKALFANTSGNANTSVGAFALRSNITGYSNTATGYNALVSNTTGNANTATGISALYSNTTGISNSAYGAGALVSTTTGNSNTAVGANALSSNTTGYSNVAIGFRALYRNTSVNNLVAVGDSALYNNGVGATGIYEAKYNTAIGSKVLHSNTTGYDNTATGYNSLLSNTTGYTNTATGVSALALNTTGYSNTAMGFASLYGQHSGSYNTAIGYVSQFNALNCDKNTSLGANSLHDNTIGSSNTAIGYESLFYNTGSYNTANGSGAGSYNNNNSYCTFIGYEADQTVVSDFTNSTALGSQSTITASNQVRIGNSSITSIGGQVGWSTLSDGRYKKQVKDNVPGLQFIKKLKPVTYHLDVSGVANKLNENRNDDKTTSKQNDDGKASVEKGGADKERVLYTGFIAQDVEKSAKEIGYDFSGVDAPKNDNDLYGLRYDAFVVPLVKAVQELSGENEKLKSQNDAQQKINMGLQQQIDELKKAINYNQQISGNRQPEIVQLDQNTPNPFSHTTSISYTLPQKFSDAQLIITDKNGKTVKQISIAGAGKEKINIDALLFASGTYSYSLMIDGKIISSKQMVFMK